jgi:hypothetical protein
MHVRVDTLGTGGRDVGFSSSFVVESSWIQSINQVKDYNMRRTFKSIAAIGFLVGVSVSAVSYGGWPEMKHAMGVDYARNNCWPQPFRSMDANSVVAPFQVMQNNGWREYNTVAGPFFTSSGLSDAGQLKVQWIVTQAPQNQRVVYVKSGRTSEETAARVESVQLLVSQLIPTGPLPQILVTDIEPSTSSGAYQTRVARAINDTTPIPRLGRFTGLNAPSQQQVAPATSKGK